MSSFSFVVAYLVVGGLTKTLIVLLCLLYLKMVYIVRSNHKNLSFPRIYDMFSFVFFEFLCLTTLTHHH